VEDKYPSGGGFPSVFLRGTNHPAIPQSSTASRTLSRAPFSLMYSQIFVLTRRYHSLRSPGRRARAPPPPPSAERVIRPRAYMCNAAREYASTRDRRAGCPLFSSPPSRGVEFISRPNALVLPRMASFDCFDYPYLIPRGSSLRASQPGSLSRVSFLPSIPIFRSRFVTSESVPVRRGPASLRHRYIRRSRMDIVYIAGVADEGWPLKFTKGKGKGEIDRN